MIYLTGDVHGKIAGYWEQRLVGSELDTAKRYLDILKKNELSSTLFINGICLKKNPVRVKELLEYDVEIGGHTYNNFGKLGIVKSYIYRKLFGCIYGPMFYQKRDIKKTKKVFKNLGLEMISWRTHAFGSNEKTFKILGGNGVKYVSDLLGDTKPYEKGVIHVPVNIPVDVVTIAYGPLCPENRDCFASCTKGRIKPEEWFEIIKKRIIANEGEGVDSVLLIHPETMAALDDFELFERIAKFLSKYKSRKICDFKLKI